MRAENYSTEQEICALGVVNALYLEKCQENFDQDPASFHPFPQRGMRAAEPVFLSEKRAKEADIWRRYGWRTAKLDPLERQKAPDTLIALMEQSAKRLEGVDKPYLEFLKKTYSGTIGAEFMHLEDPAERQWWIDQLENTPEEESDFLSSAEIYEILEKAERFEKFCHQKFPALRRFSLEGSESLSVALTALMKDFALYGGRELAVGLSHRGRVNLLGGTLGAGWERVFGEFLSQQAPEGFHGGGDVKYHLGFESALAFPRTDRKLSVRVLPNPSHLEAVNAVSLGYVRAQQDKHAKADRASYAALLVHGDTAFAGQGVVYETFQMSQLSGYRTGGTLHVIVNNQVGFTLEPEEAYSGSSCASLGKAFDIPILHVNGDDPDAVVRAARLAVAWRQAYQRDVIIDLIGYRRLGHNETDDASFTQPLAVEAIRAHPGVLQKYKEKLLRSGRLLEDQALAISADIRAQLEAALAAAQSNEGKNRLFMVHQKEDVTSLRDDRAARIQPMTGIPLERIRRILGAFDPEKIAQIWPEINLSPRLSKFLAERQQIRQALSRAAVEKETAKNVLLDWSTAEALALGSIALDGHGIRLAGEDSGRGTFSHRHFLTTDQKSGKRFSLLEKIGPRQGHVEIIDSLLSEYAAMGFEYGFGLGDPNVLGMWEAQFGDFANGAQIMIDQFIASGEEKWDQPSSLVLLLPHGYEGGGPEHTSARIERFLQLAACNNLRICMPSSPASYFHLLRRQKTRRCSKPLILFSPKSLLRRKAARSSVSEIGPHTRFEPILRTASGARLKESRRLILCSGKIFYDLQEKLEKEDIKAVGFLRLEQFYPFPLLDLIEALKACEVLEEVLWVQEEPENMGPRAFLLPWIEEALKKAGKDKVRFQVICRAPTSAVAAGWMGVHQREQQALIQKAFEALPKYAEDVREFFGRCEREI